MNKIIGGGRDLARVFFQEEFDGLIDGADRLSVFLFFSLLLSWRNFCTLMQWKLSKKFMSYLRGKERFMRDDAICFAFAKDRRSFKKRMIEIRDCLQIHLNLFDS